MKNVSTADLEKALAKALAEISGWAHAQVHIQQVQFAAPLVQQGENITLHLSVQLRADDSDDMLF